MESCETRCDVLAPLTRALRCRAGILQRPEGPDASTQSSRQRSLSFNHKSPSSMWSQSNTTPAKQPRYRQYRSPELGFDCNNMRGQAWHTKTRLIWCDFILCAAAVHKVGSTVPLTRVGNNLFTRCVAFNCVTSYLGSN